MRGIRYLLWALLALALLLAGAFWLYSRAVLPVTDGTLDLPGAGGEIRIERDADGVPTIRAGNLQDLMFGLGVAHAQDRLWQMETHRRIGAGRLSEAFGEGALDTDRFLRALGVRRAAAAQWERTQGESREVLLAYTRGVNAVLQRQAKVLPPEFLILGVKPQAWDPVDSLAWGVMMAWDLGGNWGTELLRARLALKLPVNRINELLPPYPGDQPLATADYAALFRELKLGDPGGRQARLAAPPSGVEGVGSNNWVVAGSRSQSGKPLLANDPHLKLSAPALWYFARLEAPGFKMAGATMPGLPLVVLGQSQHIAWGFTNTGPDVQDLYLEKINPDDPSQYQTPDGWAAFDAVDEVIRVKGKPDVKLQVRRTRHGPVISDAGVADDLIGPAGRPAYAIAMRWTALDADAEPIGANLATTRATSVEQYIAASSAWVAPMQNMVVADTAGHIGFVAAGRVPLRHPDNDLHGVVPVPGWDARYDWTGFVPAQATPRETDPPRGFIATANQRIHAKDYPYFLGNDWALPYRQQRIEHLLQARPQHTADSFAAMQADVQSLAAAPLLPWLMKAQATHPLAAAARTHLQGFDGTMAADRAAPLIFWAWARHLTQRVFADELGSIYERSLSSRSYRDALEGVLARNDGWWCDDKATPAAETCAAQADAALNEALAELQARLGDDVAQWRWGDVHQARSEHRPFSKVKALSRWFELRTPVGGDTYTVNVSRVALRPDTTTGELYLDEHGPSLRAIYDLADPAQSRFMHSSGQSGIVSSPLYRNFAERWARVEYLPLWGRGAPAHTLLVRPAAAGPAGGPAASAP
ncbi:penicillin acylase family protein [Ideonella sp. BN130291]|uniref:penicillin acylase family protein n=1 Tax=Ideonella sp. BN130291 TaxID=3112940 RepID=UPI002E274AE6|nr:penicillin acylase family protein [Ideonella sp. BN130291]